ncbi:Angiopoietin-related protein 3 [Labeo rohita]|uniref:Angiopoietin-related protein 3 n=1 Tax=Labeo rohita TaxID=84645 RepID=A0ABQ8MYL4_LABRO|nr:Angiopoietin-related protein 3 [Labeo rohita]
MKLLVLLLLLASSHSFPTEPTFAEQQTESRLRFAALDDVRLLANGLLQLGHSLRDFVQNTKNQINAIFQKLNIFDKSFYQLSVLASEIKEEEEELKKTTVILKTNNEEIKSLSLEINSKVEDIIKERNHLRSQVGSLEEKLSGLSQSLFSAEQIVEISTLKEIILTQEKSITDLLKALNSAHIQETDENLDRRHQSNSISGYLPYFTSDGSFSSDLPEDCGDVFSRGQKSSGLYAIKPHESQPFLRECSLSSSADMTALWTLTSPGRSMRMDLGTSAGHSLLHFQIEDWRREMHFMLYQYILEDAASNYTIHVKLQSAESSSAVDEHTGFRFSTKDHNDGNHDSNCAQDYTGGWWFSICGDINLNGKCIQSRPRKKGVHWKPGRGTASFKASKISISHLTKPQTP